MSRYRNKVIYVRVTEEEKKNILAKMKKAGMTNLDEFVRKALMVGDFVHFNTEGLKDLKYEINKIGVNINQIAKAVNTSGNIYVNEIENIQKQFTYILSFIEDLNLKTKKAEGKI